MEPVTTLTAATIATLVLTKAIEKTGEKLGEKAFESSGKLLKLLKHKDPEIATAIEQTSQQPALPEQPPLNLGIATIVERVETLSQQDPEVKAAVEEVANETRSQPNAIYNMTKLAEKIGILIQGGYNPITIKELNV